MKSIVAVIASLTLLFTGIFIVFMFRINSIQGAFNYPASNISEPNKQAIEKTLKAFQEGYTLRDVSKIGECIAQTIDTASIFILGTNPNEIFKGKEGVQRLLYGDWAYWGNVKYDIDRLYADQITDSIAYVVFPGNITLDFNKMNFPLQVTSVMVQDDDGQWKFSKMQFIYGWNTNYIIFARTAAYGTLILLMALLMACIIWYVLGRKK
ncbi:MAG: nuclear transport factor 2 family protein [Salinivirgaceae bacterium]|nr:nuclear transport factor 2 family protein [Salinivirgaceae bacterium]